MNTNRKAELQRKLSMTSVPRPPADLASRIKRDIPQSIGDPRPAARWWSGASMRIAASLLLVIASAYLGVRLLSRAPMNEAPGAPSMAARAAKSITDDRGTPRAPEQEPALTAEAPPLPTPAASPEPPRVAAAPSFAPESGAASLKKDDQRSERADRAQTKEEATPASRDLVAGTAPETRELNAAAAPPPPSAASSAAPKVVAQPTARPQTITVTASAPAVIENHVERALQPAPAAAEGGVVGGSEPGFPSAKSKIANDAVIAIPRSAVARSIAPSMFGISTDPAAIEAVRTAVQRGEQPADVNIEAIVNYFAGIPEESPKRLSLQVEGSPPPVLATPRTRIVRVTIDTPFSAAADAPVAATDANLTITFDDNAVATERLIGGAASLTASQRVVLKNTSVTALYEIVLRPSLRNRQKVVTARLTYRDGNTGREQSLRIVLRLADLDRAWLDASRRHRLASLGAIWGESLKSSTGGADVARRAEELARQQPLDRKAHELAELASASYRRRSSGPTGSGR